MIKKGKVLETDNNTALVAIPKESACAGSCINCRGCTITNVRAKVDNKIGATIGDMVEVTFPDNSPLGLAFLVFLAPVIAPLAIFFLLKWLINTAAGIVGAVIAVIVWLYFVFKKDRKMQAEDKTLGAITNIVPNQDGMLTP